MASVGDKRKQSGDEEKKDSSPQVAKTPRSKSSFNRRRGFAAIDLEVCGKIKAAQAATTVAELFGLSKEHSSFVIDIAQTLKPDDPALCISLALPRQLRQALLVTGADGNPVVAGRPCDPGTTEQESFDNIKSWVTGLVPGHPSNATVTEAGPTIIGIGNLTTDEHSAISNALIHAGDPFDWVIAFRQAGCSLGGVLSITGTAVGSATINNLSSTVFRDGL